MQRVKRGDAPPLSQLSELFQFFFADLHSSAQRPTLERQAAGFFFLWIYHIEVTSCISIVRDSAHHLVQQCCGYCLLSIYQSFSSLSFIVAGVPTSLLAFPAFLQVRMAICDTVLVNQLGKKVCQETSGNDVTP